MDSQFTAFSVLSKSYRERLGLSCNELARAMGVDPSYCSRWERGERSPPRLSVVQNMADALQLDMSERDRLLVSAGHAPSSVDELGGWDPILEGVAMILTDKRLSEQERDEFRDVVNTVVKHWRFRHNGV